MQVLDFEDFIPEEKFVKLKDKQFNVSEIPFEIALQVNQVLPVLTDLAAGKEIEEENFKKLFKLIYSIFKVSDPELDEAWLQKNLTLPRFNKIITFIFEAIFDDGKKKEE
jgi:hypothetical protein